MKNIWTEIQSPAWWFTLIMGIVLGLVALMMLVHYQHVSRAFIRWSVKRITIVKNKWLRHIERGVTDDAYFVKCLKKRNACDLYFYGTVLAVWIMSVCFFTHLSSSSWVVLLFAIILTFLLELYFGYRAAYYECLTEAMMKTGNERNRAKVAALPLEIDPLKKD